ncbi:MAG: J domain-containing protein [Oscillospiraceae bacterium]|nr:J domain-containing protein [Oscillospiraceae bacterium]
MKDPYSVLNVSPTASDSEVKKAYRDLARKYHPDNYMGNDLADLAQEKMKQINEAYDEINRQRQNKGPRDDASGWGGPSEGGSAAYAHIRQMIISGRIAEAEQALLGIANRDAEWYYLMGGVLYRKGWFDEAARHMERASAMDPGNMEYRQARDRMRSGAYRQSPYGQGYGHGYQHGYRQDRGMDGCECCAWMLCAQMCCGCCRSD